MAEILCDEALRQRHLTALQTEESRAMYDRTLAACAQRGEILPSDQDMIFDLCCHEDVKQALQEDIRARGVTVETRNGRQIYKKENPALARLCRYAELQRRIRADLRITPAKRGGNDAEEDSADAEDDFDRF